MANQKKLSEMTTLRAQEESKRRAFEEGEMIEAMGQVSDQRAQPDVRRYFKSLELEENGYRDEAYQILFGLRNDRLKYNQFLVAVFSRFASQEDISKRVKYYAKADKTGLIVGIKGTKYLAAFKSTGIPQYDYHACKIRAVQLGNTNAKLLGYTRQTEAGIIIPDSEDLKQYSHGR